jgi:hypothetical protein
MLTRGMMFEVIDWSEDETAVRVMKARAQVRASAENEAAK